MKYEVVLSQEFIFLFRKKLSQQDFDQLITGRDISLFTSRIFNA